MLYTIGDWRNDGSARPPLHHRSHPNLPVNPQHLYQSGRDDYMLGVHRARELISPWKGFEQFPSLKPVNQSLTGTREELLEEAAPKAAGVDKQPSKALNRSFHHTGRQRMMFNATNLLPPVHWNLKSSANNQKKRRRAKNLSLM